MNIQQIIDAAEQIAVGMGNDPNKSISIDSEMTAEDLLPLAIRHSYKTMLQANEISIQDVMREYTITVASAAPYAGLTGTMPAGLLVEFLDQAILPAYEYSAYLPGFADYNRDKFTNLLCYWTIENYKFYTTCGSAGTIKLHAPGVPTLPADATTTVDIPTRILDTVIYTLAMAIRGELKLNL